MATKSIAILGAGVSGLTCGVLFAENGYRAVVFAKEVGQQTTSGAAAAMWFPYDARPREKVIPWALETYKMLLELVHDSRSGVSMIELRQFSRSTELQIPDWAVPLGATRLSPLANGLWPGHGGAYTFAGGFSLKVPLMDTTIYLEYLANRFAAAGGSIASKSQLEKLEDVDQQFNLVINCAGIGARDLVHDMDLEPHRGQVAIVPRIEALPCAIVCDDAPLMYAIPRTNDCLFGGTNTVSHDLVPDPATTGQIVAECSRVLGVAEPAVLADRVGLRPFRKSGVRLERDHLHDGRTVIHNYGHGGSGFTLSWGCAREVFGLAAF